MANLLSLHGRCWVQILKEITLILFKASLMLNEGLYTNAHTARPLRDISFLPNHLPLTVPTLLTNFDLNYIKIQLVPRREHSPRPL